METLGNKTAIVTGSSRGIGRGIAERLAREGARIVLTGRDQAALQEVQTSIGSNAAAIALDLREPAAARQLVEFAFAKFGRIDILVNNAGATKRGEFEDLTDADFEDGFSLKYFGAVRLTREAWPQLKASSGSLINIAGVGGRTPGRQFAIGGSVNAAVLSFTKAMAEVGLRDGVQVNCISPGTVRTARFQTRLEMLAREQGIEPAKAEDQYRKQQNIRMIGEPADIAALVAFIASEDGRMLHSSLIDMDAGFTKTI